MQQQQACLAAHKLLHHKQPEDNQNAQNDINQ